MKVLLINPLIENILKNVPQDIIEFRDIGYPNLGLLYIASFIEQNSNHDIKIFDMQIENAGYRELENYLRKYRPHVIGVPATSFTLVDSLITCRIAKQVDPDTINVIGGRHGSLYPRETVNLDSIDFVIVNEGEYAFLDLLREMEGEKKYEKIKGISFKDQGEVIFTGYRPWIRNIDKLPFPARHLIPYKKYKYALSGKKIFSTIMTSRGCPCRCLFCDRSQGNRVRVRSVMNVADEMEMCAKMGIQEIFIKDDTFTINKRRVTQICDEIINRRLGLDISIRTRVDLIDEEIIKKLKQAGCKRIQYGIESGNQRILDLLKKKITLDQTRKAVKMAKKYNIDTLGEFMIGSPGEGEREVFDTVKFAIELDLNYVLFNITTPYPGTELYKMGMEKGLFEDFWMNFAKDPMRDSNLRFWTEHFEEEQLASLIKKVYKKYYRRPKYVIKSACKIKSISELTERIRFALKIFGM